MYKDRFDSKIGCKGTAFFLYTQYFAQKTCINRLAYKHPNATAGGYTR